MRYRFLLLLIVFVPIFCFGQYTIENLPNPKISGQDYFVSNPDYILNPSTVQVLNEQLQALEKSTSVEFAVVVVDRYMGNDDFSFAHSLFNKWGIGKRENNKGLLLFIAKDTRQYRFITGYGLEADLPDATLKRIGEKFLVPNFRKGDYDKGVKEAVLTIVKYLKPESFVKNNKTNLFSDIVSFFDSNNYLKLLPILLFLFGVFIIELLDFRIRKHIFLFNSDLDEIDNLLIVIIRYLVGFTIFCFFSYLASVLEIKNGVVLSVSFVIILIIWLKVVRRYRYYISYIQNEEKDALELETAYKQVLNSTYLWFLFNPLSWHQFFLIKSNLNELKTRLSPPDLSGNWYRVVRKNTNVDLLLSKGQQVE